VKAHEILPLVQELYVAGDYEEAERIAAILEREERKRPEGERRFLQGALRSRGVVAIRRSQPELALRCFEEALALDPADPDVHFSLALYYLIRGDYARGFAEYEWRLGRPNCIAPDMARQPFWDGRVLRADEPLLVHCEQGAGDAIQCIRLLPLLKERAPTVHLACHDSLHRLFARTGATGMGTVLDEQTPVPPHAFQLPLLSIPHRLGLTLDAIPKAVPYLSVANPPPPLPPRAGRPLHAGIVWRAKPHEGDYRSARLADVAPLFDLPKATVEWTSLQKETTDEERVLLQEKGVVEAGSGFADFHDTAEALLGLDLVVTVDTAVAHLAGALAKPAWVLLPKWAEWRWLLDRRDSPWYPTLTLFRQRSDRDWSGPVGEARAALMAAVAQAHRHSDDRALYGN
jgi:hypothetical protein